MLNRAALQLATLIEERGYRHEDVERLLDMPVGSGSVTRWLSGDRKPGRALAYRIESRLGILMSEWERPARAARGRRAA